MVALIKPPDVVDVMPETEPRWSHVRVLLIHAGAVLLFTLLTLTSALAIVRHPASTVAPDLIDPVFNVWAVATADHNAMTWPDGVWSFFHANIFYPTPHAGAYTDVFTGLLPFSLLLHLVVNNPVVLANVLVALSFVLSAYGAFLLAHELTGRYTAAIVAGLIFGFCPLRAEHVGHLNVISTQWLIFATYCAVRAWRSGRWQWWIATGLLAGLSAMVTLYYLAYLAMPLLITLLLLGKAWTRRRLCYVMIAATIGLSMVVPFTIPYLLRHAVADAHYGGAAATDLLSFLQVLPGRPIDSALLPMVPLAMMSPNHGLFPGMAVVALSIIALRRRCGGLWLVFALLCALMALGPVLKVHGHTFAISLPYAWLSELVPDFRLFRDPVRATVGFYLGIAMLSAWGLRVLLEELRGQTRRLLLCVGALAITALELWSPVPTVSLAAIPHGEYWLARQASIHVVVELPIVSDEPLAWQRQTAIMYDSTVHWKALVNGTASLDPVGMARTRAILSTYPSEQARALLRRLRVDAIVLRLTWLSPEQRAVAQAACHPIYRDAVEEICHI